MNNLISLSEKINLLQQHANKQKSLSIHKDNIFSKEVGKILSELRDLEIILSRISGEAGGGNKTSELNLDIKSLHIFGFIFVESIIYFLRLFFPEVQNIKFDSIGKFLKSVENQGERQEDTFRDFIAIRLVNIQNLNDTLREFRGLVSHEKKSTVEWTFTDPLRPMTGSKIVNVPWREDKEFQETSSLSPSQFIDLITKEVGEIIDYLITFIDAPPNKT